MWELPRNYANLAHLVPLLLLLPPPPPPLLLAAAVLLLLLDVGRPLRTPVRVFFKKNNYI